MSKLTDSIGAMVESKWADVVQAQESHKANAGRFCQLLATKDEIPRDGAEVEPDKLERKAGGESKSWKDFAGILPAKLRAKIELHVYDGPEGKGFALVVTVGEGSTTVQRVWNHGPESWRESNWVDITIR